MVQRSFKNESVLTGEMDNFSYLNVVQIVEQRWFLHTEVVRDQSVETIGQIQYLGLGQ